MEFTYVIHPTEELIITTVKGVVTMEAYAQGSNELFADPLFNTKYDILVDARGATSQISKVELYAFANYLNQSEMFGKARYASIVNDPMLVALNQIFKSRMIDSKITGIFSTVEAAAHFLDKPELNDLIE